MRRKGVYFLAAAAICFLMSCLSETVKAAEEESPQNRYNVVFVTDESGSMESTDPEKLRYEAIRMFTGYAAQSGNYMGSVSYNGGIIREQQVKEVDGFEQKNSFTDRIASAKPEGFTNIGLGLKKAVETLDKDRNKDLPSVIILLTDGNTEMPDDDQTQKSLDMKADAIERARQSGYKIYTICLNTDGSADVSEMQQIASATGGEFSEVTSPEDLEAVQTIYYKIIFAGIDSDPESIQFDQNGIAVKDFEIPEIGVEEVNIIFKGQYTDYDITDPKISVYSKSELKSMSMSGTDFTLVKILNPMGGAWKATVYGSPGASINVKLLQNTSFSINTAISPTENYKIGQKVTFNTQIYDAKGSVDDISKYRDFTGTVHITANGEEKTYEMVLDDKGFTYDYVIPDKGTYYAYINVAGDKMSADSNETYEFGVENQTPVPADKELTAHANRWPFIGGTASIDLKGAASDPDKQKLTYTIESTAFNEEDYKLDGTVLKVDGFSISKGSFMIRATDTYGAYCTFPVLITSTNIGLIMALAVCLGGILVLLILGVIIYKKKFIPFMGTITVEKFDEDSAAFSQSISLTPGRGSVRLESFVPGVALPAGCRFQAGGKDKNIYFRSKKPVYSDITGGAVKKITIEGSGSEVRISADSRMEKGIIVTFKSLLYNQYF